ncbi:MAG: ribonuclease P protein subunit [Thermoplasmata archaeon]|nr:MAG: ribonuclease P protein subunit [Thermoplasmata archaeon]
MRTAKNILQHELIGVQVTVTDCSIPEICNTEGIIVDESRNMLVIEQNQRDVKVPKQGTKFAFKLPADENKPDDIIELEIKGEQIIARPEDRVKKNEGKARRK